MPKPQVEKGSLARRCSFALAALLIWGCDGPTLAEGTLPGQSNPIPPLFEPTAAMPVFSGLDRTDPDVCLDGSCPFTSLAKAAKAAREGATIVVSPGLYAGDCLDARGKSLAIVGLVGPNDERATFETPCARKAAFVMSGERFLIQGVRVRGIKVPNRNGACVRVEGQNQVQRGALVNMHCRGSENGILGSAGNGTLIIRGSLFEFNGGNNGFAHGLYMVGGEELLIQSSVIRSTTGRGHSLKAGSKRLIIERSIVAGLDGTNSRTLDYFSGGVLLVRGSVFEQGPGSDNNDMIGLALEGRRVHAGSHQATLIVDSWFIYDDDRRASRHLFRGNVYGSIRLDNVALVGLTGSLMDYEEIGPVKTYKDRVQAGLPPYDNTINALPKVNKFVQ